jgi:hypothetical protein
MVLPGAPLIPELELLRAQPLPTGGWAVDEPPTQRISATGLAVLMGLLLLAWFFADGFRHLLGWLWILLSGVAVYVIARAELTFTSLHIEPAGVRIRTGFPRSPRTRQIPVQQIREVRVLTRTRSRQSLTSYLSQRYLTYQIALALNTGSDIAIFRELRDEQLALRAAQRLSGMLASVSVSAAPAPPPKAVQPPPSGMRLTTGIALVGAAGLVFFLIARAC